MKRIITHSGTFHLDETFAITLLAKFYFKTPALLLDIVRTRDENVIKMAQADNDTFVIDIGEKFDPKKLNFDHHQKDQSLFWDESVILGYDKKPIKVPKSACGLIWDWLTDHSDIIKKMPPSVRYKILKMVQEIDLSDNGVSDLKTSNDLRIFFKFNRQRVKNCGGVLCDEEYENEQFNQFRKALQIAEWHIENIIFLKTKEILNKKKVKLAIRHAKRYGHKEILFFKNDEFNSKRLGCMYSNDAKMIAVYNEESKYWSIRIVNESKNSLFKGKLKMPSRWAGLSGEKLKSISGLEHLQFCHKERFMLKLEDCTKEDCLHICYKIINNFNIEKL